MYEYTHIYNCMNIIIDMSMCRALKPSASVSP